MFLIGELRDYRIPISSEEKEKVILMNDAIEHIAGYLDRLIEKLLEFCNMEDLDLISIENTN